MITKYTHPKDCPDHKEAAADRKSHEAEASAREKRNQLLAHAEWLDWYAPSRPRRT
jgi:hypothetical protein